jgi:hypothetical protein
MIMAVRPSLISASAHAAAFNVLVDVARVFDGQRVGVDVALERGLDGRLRPRQGSASTASDVDFPGPLQLPSPLHFINTTSRATQNSGPQIK